VDPGGAYQTRSGELVKFAGPRDLARFLAGSEEVHASFAEQLFHHLVKQPVRAYGARRLPDLRPPFAPAAFNLRRLLVHSLPPAGWWPGGRGGPPCGGRTPRRRRRLAGLPPADYHPFGERLLRSKQPWPGPAPDATSSATWASARRRCRSSATCPAWGSPTSG